jgi:flagellar motor switch protein FliN/FliY
MSEPALNKEGVPKTTVEDTLPSQARTAEQALKPFLSVPFEVSIELGRSKLKIRDLLRLGNQSVFELDKPAGGALDIYVNGTLVCRGEPIILEDRVQIKVTEIVESNE